MCSLDGVFGARITTPMRAFGRYKKTVSFGMASRWLTGPMRVTHGGGGAGGDHRPNEKAAAPSIKWGRVLFEDHGRRGGWSQMTCGASTGTQGRLHVSHCWGVILCFR